MRRISRLFVFGALLVVTSCTVAPEAQVAGKFADSAVTEASGLAASHTMQDVYWAHNDSGGEPVLYASTSDGAVRGRLRVAGVQNIDWEDLASFDYEGRPYLVLADVGDNYGMRRECRLYVIPEPAASEVTPGVELQVAPSWVIPVRYPEGPMDCESVAVDAKEGFFYLLSKRTKPPVLYRLPIHPQGDLSHLYAERRGPVPHFIRPSSFERLFPTPRQRYRGQPTAMDFSTDGRRALVLTYREIMLYERKPGESWDIVLGGHPVVTLPHSLDQAEGACFSRDGRYVYAVSEGEHQPIVRWDLSSLKAP